MSDSLYNIVDQILIPHTAMTEALKRISQCLKASYGSAEPICIAQIGEARTGKTRILEYLEAENPPQRFDDGMRTPILRVRVPSNPTVKGLAETLLRKLGDPLPKGTETNLTHRLIRLLQAAEVRMMMLDEFQHFYDRQSHKVMHHVADWLKLVVDESRVALVVTGLPSLQNVLAQNEQLAGRFSAPIRMPRFDWTIPPMRAEFIGILGAFRNGLSDFDLPALDDEEMAFRFYCASGGLIGYIVKILRQAVWNALDRETGLITMEDLGLAYQQSVYVEEQAEDLPSSFDRSFDARPNLALLERAAQIGIAQPEEAFPRRRGRSTQPTGTSGIFRK